MKEENNKGVLLKKSIVFQIKLMIDALRDFLLSPIAIVCALLDLFMGKDASAGYFQKLMLLGQKSDKWLNLFNENDDDMEMKKDIHQQAISEKSSQENNADQIFAKVEAIIKEQHEKGGLTASAKNSIDKYLNKLIKKE